MNIHEHKLASFISDISTAWNTVKQYWFTIGADLVRGKQPDPQDKDRLRQAAYGIESSAKALREYLEK